MKRLLLLGTLLAVASFATGCATCGGYGGYGVCGTVPMSCYPSCDPCGGYVAACPAKYVSPYAGQYYSGDECGPCGGCSSGCGGCGGCNEGYRPFARLCNLFSMGGNSCGCACEKYYGDYINNPPSLCNPCDQFGGLAGFSAKCSSGMCDTCSPMSYSPVSYSPMSYTSMPYAPVSQPIVQPAPMMTSPASECKTCNQGNTFYTSRQVRPQPQVQPVPVRQNPMIARNQVPMQQPVIIAQTRPAQVPQTPQQPALQDKLVTAGTQQVNYNMYPVNQAAFGSHGQFGSTNKVIQPATIPANGRVVHAK
ncbi:MAG: hypothetical protein FWH27_06085 [Planctomycetaceae bacterium]|nr:hypothetical protein [Planctomycetaceae bacterium]